MACVALVSPRVVHRLRTLSKLTEQARIGYPFFVTAPKRFSSDLRNDSKVVPAATGKNGDEKFDPEKPIQYSTSDAFDMRVLDFEKADDSNNSKAQNRIVALSLSVFMTYFFFLREENDLDRMMGAPLWDRVPGLEKQTLIALIENNKKEGKPTPLAEARLAQIIAEEEAAKKQITKTATVKKI